MNTLWTFGDSFTFGRACREDCFDKSYLEYRKQGDDIWPNHLSKMLQYEVKNLGKNGVSNDYIFDSIIKNYDEIEENDVVIIGKTIYGRIELPNKYNEWVRVLSESEKKDWWIIDKNNGFDEFEMKTIIDFQYLFSNNKLYKNRHDERFEFIEKLLTNHKKVKKCYVWQIQERKFIENIEKIIDATKYKIKDYHFSFKGHLDFANFLYGEIKMKKAVI